jgi:hypothetical protein
MIRDLLIRAYPRSWRKEFGHELAGILAMRKLTPALVVDVLASAALQHLNQDPWKICALGLAVWTSGLLILASEGIIGRPAFLWCYFAGQLFLFAAGAWTGLRRDGGIWSAMAASAKAALVPVAGCIVVAGLSIVHSWGGSHEVHGHNVTYWIWKNVVITILTAVLFGLAGAAVGHLVNRFRRTVHARA